MALLTEAEVRARARQWAADNPEAYSRLFPQSEAAMNTIPSISQAFDGAGVPLDQRDSVTALAAARRVGYSLPLPAEPVGSPIEYFRNTLQSQANAAIGAMNEVAVMDYDFALKAAALYWLARYKVLHQPDSSEAVKAVTGLVQDLLDGQSGPDLGFAMNAAEKTVVTTIDGRTTLQTLAAANESLSPTFDALWGDIVKTGG